MCIRDRYMGNPCENNLMSCRAVIRNCVIKIKMQPIGESEPEFKKSIVAIERPDYTYKVIIMGNSGVGKTCFIHRAVNGKFEESHEITIVTDLSQMHCVVEQKEVKLQFWDTCGLEQYRSINKAYYRGSNIALVLYDTTDQRSFKECGGFIEDLRETCAKSTVIYLVATKLDLGEKKVSEKEVQELMKQYEVEKAYEVSSKTGQGISELVEDVVRRQLTFELSKVTEEEILRDHRGRAFSVTRRESRAKIKRGCECCV
eukprot:TRINITY_DN4262_c0_g1_i10.p2 TRINITY_DN4262_c0_g1~~TRINITY_DN4262_c0_g1_i10.p2  ORF type:complete len:258 (-),score=77.16 TRINITY_DN4262_c0_g1_i10:94-867(-)